MEISSQKKSFALKRKVVQTQPFDVLFGFFYSLFPCPPDYTSARSGWDRIVQIRCLIWPMKETRVSGYFAGCPNEQCQTEVLDFKIWDAENVLCLLSGLLPGSHHLIKFISIGQVWNTDTMPDRESRSQLPRNCLSRSQDSPSRASAPLFMYETHHN